MTDPGKERVEHCLALKVMRLTRPTLGTSTIVQAGERDGDQGLLNGALIKDVNTAFRQSALLPGQLLVLPQSFGNIYLGETFSSYVCVHNDSTEVCGNVTVRADLQTASQRINLVPGTNPDTALHSRDQLPPGSTIDQVLHHEVKELGTHILVCEVSYNSSKSNAASDKLSFRKFFKFQVMKPLDVKTKFYNAESDEVFLEAQVQNITQATITLDRVTLEPSHTFTVTSLAPSEDVGEGVVGRGHCLQVGDSWQYLFCLKPRPEHNNKSLKQVTAIGKLDMVWRTQLCDRGRLQTSQLQRMAPSAAEVRLSFLTAPSFALMDHPLPLVLRLENNCERTVELDLSLCSPASGLLTWCGVTQRGLGLLEPGGSTEVTVEVVMHKTGLHSIQGISCTDTLLKRTYTFNDQCQIFVVSDTGLYQSISEAAG